MNTTTNQKMMLSNGAIFPFYLNASLLGKADYLKNELTKLRIVEMIKNSKEMYLSDLSEILEIPLKEAIEIVSILKSEGKIKSK